jgi:hypothetical protein
LLFAPKNLALDQRNQALLNTPLPNAVAAYLKSFSLGLNTLFSFFDAPVHAAVVTFLASAVKMKIIPLCFVFWLGSSAQR